jgi:chromosome segregation ATPase
MEEGPAKDELEKQIKELEKRKKRAEKSVKKAEKKIGKADSTIDQATGDIPRNERMQEKVKEQIAAQDAVYQRYADKLKRIRAY